MYLESWHLCIKLGLIQLPTFLEPTQLAFSCYLSKCLVKITNITAKPQDMLPICLMERTRRTKNNEYYITGQLECIIVPEPLDLRVWVFLVWFFGGFLFVL